MEPEYLQKQYDRFLAQVREETRDLYWLYNFFFVVESALLGSLFLGKMSSTYLSMAQISGLILSIYWLMTIYKQRLRRNDLIKRIQKIEERLGYQNELQIWPPEKMRAEMKEYIFGKRGLWRFLFLLPIGFAFTWITLLAGN